MGRPLRIDIHTHILPRDWPDLEARYGYPGFIRLEHHAPGRARMMQGARFFREIEANCWDPDVREQECDRFGIDVQVVCTVPVMFSYWAKPEHTLDLARLLNDHIAELTAARPRRFVGLGTLPMQAPDLAIRELERCVRELGLPGVQIGSHVEQWDLDAPELFPVFEAAQDLGAAILVHPWEMMGRKETPRYWMPWLVGMPAETTRAICCMIFGGVLERLPRLRVMFAHGGGAFPYTLGRIEHGFKVRPDLCAVNNDRPPSAYLDRIWTDSIVHDPDALRFLLARLGSERVALGSDYPFPLGELEPGALIDSMDDLDEATKARLFSGTALEFLGLDASRFVDGA
ncbi:MAG: amidohydrolase family protein [Acidobacteriota bacterium]